ncbi:hypothetical protein QBC39DRAFT_81698 [Podospora conica]|nr:hypothetical protein QBC39DRAFT_81698 [Schizothecium conicum]
MRHLIFYHLSAARSWSQAGRFGVLFFFVSFFHLHLEHILSTHFYWEALFGRRGIQDQELKASQQAWGPGAGRRLESGAFGFTRLL